MNHTLLRLLRGLGGAAATSLAGSRCAEGGTPDPCHRDHPARGQGGAPAGRQLALGPSWAAGEGALPPLGTGIPATALAPSPATAADVGCSLAALYALGLAAPATTATGLAGLSLAAWHQTVTQARRVGLPWAGKLGGLTPLVEQLTQRLQALQGRGRPMLLSHRDLDPKNAVVRPDQRVPCWTGTMPARP